MIQPIPLRQVPPEPHSDRAKINWFEVSVEGYGPPVMVMAKDRLSAVISILSPLGLRYRDAKFTVAECERPTIKTLRARGVR